MPHAMEKINKQMLHQLHLRKSINVQFKTLQHMFFHYVFRFPLRSDVTAAHHVTTAEPVCAEHGRW